MKVYRFFVIAVIIALTSVIVFQAQHKSKNNTLKVIHERKSVRHYIKNRPIGTTDLEILIRAGMAAPTAADKRPWAFIAVTKQEKLRELASGIDYGRMLADAGAAIVVCGLPKNSLEGIAQEFWVQDCSAATENILLAAESMNLGAVWIGVHPIPDRLAFVKKTLEIPDDVIALSIISIGYPTGIDKPKDKHDKTRIHWNKW